MVGKRAATRRQHLCGHGRGARGEWAESFSSLLWGGQQGSLPSPCCSENQQSGGRARAQAPVRRKAAVHAVRNA